jgi:chromosome segregation ATPase
MTDLLKQTLANHPVDVATGQVVEVPVEQLERMSGKIAELEARLAAQSTVEAKTREHFTSLESQLRSYERTVQSLQPKYMDALRDRGTFEKQCQKALERLEAQTAEVDVLKQKNELLETKLAEANNTLANSSNPDIAKLATVDKLEKKILALQNELDYSRKAYQDASNTHTELNREHQNLKKQTAELQRCASENLRNIHRIHAQNEMAEVNREIDELRATLENRERELERAKEELKYLKNGRRETRQGSVPRSPRTSAVLSPRARGVGGGGAGSRGTSPAPMMSSDGPTGSGGGGGSGGAAAGGAAAVPGMTFFPPGAGGNAGRWGHLRD